MIHRINIFLLSLLVALAPNFIFLQAANATTATDGWSISKRLVQGATTFYDGTKNVVLNGKNYVAKGTAAITPTASQVSKMIVRTGAVLAVDLAIKALIDGVDYVMDPANNRVKYQAPTEVGDWMVNGIVYPDMTLDQACASARPSYLHHNGSTCNYGTKDPEIIEASWAYALVNSTESEERYLPYDTVASQIIGDAASKDDAKAYVSSVADTASETDPQRQIVPISEIVNQLNQSQSIPTSNTATGEATKDQTDPNTGETVKDTTDLKLEFPVFCEWAPTVCQAAQAAINFPSTFIEKFQKWDDWINRETKPYTADETKIDTEDKRSFDFSVFNENRFNVDDQCPAPEPHTFTLAGQTVSFSFDLMPVCSILEMAKPALIAASYIYAAYIVIGASRG